MSGSSYLWLLATLLELGGMSPLKSKISVAEKAETVPLHFMLELAYGI